MKKKEINDVFLEDGTRWKIIKRNKRQILLENKKGEFCLLSKPYEEMYWPINNRTKKLFKEWKELKEKKEGKEKELFWEGNDI